MESFREQLYYSPIELKVSIFCCIAAIMSFFYYSIEPTLGLTVLSIASPTALICLITYFYKAIFGSIKSIFSLIILVCTYVILLAVPFNASWVVYYALLGIFISGLAKAFVFIFFKKKAKDNDADIDVQKEIVKKSNSITVFTAVVLFIIDCCLYSPLAGQNADLQAVLKGVNAQENIAVTENNNDVEKEEADITVDPEVNKLKAAEIEKAKKNIVSVQTFIDKKGYANVDILYASEENENGAIAIATVSDKKVILVYDKGTKAIAWIEYNDELLNFINAKYAENEYKPVRFNLLLPEDKNDNKNKDQKLGRWENDVHNIPVQVLYTVQNDIVVPGQIMSANMNTKPSKYDIPLMEPQNVFLVNAVLTNMKSLKKNMEILE